MRRKPRRKGDRLIEFLTGRVIVLLGFIFSGGIVDCINCNPVPLGTRNHPPEAHPQKCGLTSADSGLQLDLEIALSGVPAKVQPHGLTSARPKMR